MQRCFLVKEQTIWGSWISVMVCASQDDAFIAAEALGFTETNKPKGQVVALAYQSGELKMALCYIIEKKYRSDDGWVAVAVTMGKPQAETLAESYGIDETNRPLGRVVPLPLL